MQYVDNAMAAADKVYSDILDTHGEDYAAQWPQHVDGTIDLDTPRVIRCMCGYVPKAQRYPKRARGLHLAAVRKQANKAWNETYDSALEAHRRYSV